MESIVKDYEHPVTVAELRKLLNSLDSSYDNLPIGRDDGEHEYWGGLSSKVHEVHVREEQIDGPKKAAVRCLFFD